MQSKFWCSEGRRRWSSVVQWMLAWALILPLLLVSPSAPAASMAQAGAGWAYGKSANSSNHGQIDPRLAQLAVEQPEQLVRVIVQKLTQD